MTSAAVVRGLPDFGQLPVELRPLQTFLDAVREQLQTRDPAFQRASGSLDTFVTHRELVGVDMLTYTSGGAYTPGPATGSGPADTTAPPVITGLTVTAGFSGAFVEFDDPSYSAGGGNAFTKVYAANYSGSGPLPTFADAVWVGTMTKTQSVYFDKAPLGTQRHYWVAAVTSGGVEQSPPTGGLNGVSCIVGLVATGDMANGSVTNAILANLAVDSAKIADAAVVNAKIANLAVTTGKIDDLAVTTAKIALLAVTSAVIANAAVTTAKIDDLAVTQAKIGLAAVGTAQIDNLAVTSAKIGDAEITTLKLATGAAASLASSREFPGTSIAANTTFSVLSAPTVPVDCNAFHIVHLVSVYPTSAWPAGATHAEVRLFGEFDDGSGWGTQNSGHCTIYIAKDQATNPSASFMAQYQMLTGNAYDFRVKFSGAEFRDSTGALVSTTNVDIGECSSAILASYR